MSSVSVVVMPSDTRWDITTTCTWYILLAIANRRSQEGTDMSQALRKSTKPVIPPRGGEVVRARPAMGDHQRQVDAAFAKTFERYERTFEELADR